ncbi:hypothetical protein Tco_0854333, partial [Tanacetum coccineum]
NITPPDTYSVQGPFEGVTDWYQSQGYREPETTYIRPTIPLSPDYTPASPNYSPASDSESDPSEDPSSDHIPLLPAISPFLSSTDDTTESDTPDTPPSPTHDDSAQDSSSDSSSEASSDFHSNASSDSSLRHSLSDHYSPNLPSTSAGPSRKRRRSPMTYVPALPPVAGALSPIHANLIPSPKRIRSPEEVGLGVDVEDESSEQSRSRGTDIEVDDDVERSDGMDIDPVEAVIEACFDFADIIRTSGVDVRVEVVTVARDDVETGTRDPIVVSDDGDTPPVVPEEIPEPAQEGAAGGTYETLGSLVQRFYDIMQAIPVHHIQVIEGVQREQGHRIVGVESTVTALTEMVAKLERDNRRLRGTASVESQRVDRLQHDMSHMQKELRQIRRFQFYDRACEAARTLEPLNENGDEQKGENGRNGNGENGNGNRNGNHCMNNGGTECVVGLTGWFEKMETMFNISNCPSKYQVKYATFTLQDSALTWWNSHKRTIGVDAAYAMKWVGLMKLMIEVYCPRNEIQKMETKLMVPDKEDKVKRFIGGLPDNIQGNVIVTNPARLQDAIRIAN